MSATAGNVVPFVVPARPAAARPVYLSPAQLNSLLDMAQTVQTMHERMDRLERMAGAVVDRCPVARNAVKGIE